jgi:uncharacterized membrane protein
MIVAALLSSFAYATDAVIAKKALDELSVDTFYFIVSAMYAVIFFVLSMYNGKKYIASIVENPSSSYIAVAAVLIGTIFADLMMWLAIEKSSKTQLPLAIALIHSSPIIALILVTTFFGIELTWNVIVGVILLVTGTLIASIRM